MKNTIATLALILLSTLIITAQQGGKGRPHYGGGSHKESHGGHYSGGSGSSHKGGTYTAPNGYKGYGTHKGGKK